jgi:hypothetical protein
MAINLSTAFVTLFDAEVKQAYQGQAMFVALSVFVQVSKARPTSSPRSVRVSHKFVSPKLMLLPST